MYSVLRFKAYFNLTYLFFGQELKFFGNFFGLLEGILYLCSNHKTLLTNNDICTCKT